MTTASVMAVAMDTFTVPRRTPKYAVARRTRDIRIQTGLENSSKDYILCHRTPALPDLKTRMDLLRGLFVAILVPILAAAA